MPSTFEQRFNDRALQAANRAFGVQVVFKRGSDESAEFTSRRNTQEYEVPGAEFGLQTVVRMRDFYLAASDLVVDSVAVEPRQGDIVREVATGYEYEILPVGDRPAAEELSGEYDWFVHTKRIQ